jgi:hypothetical protein
MAMAFRGIRRFVAAVHHEPLKHRYVPTHVGSLNGVFEERF